MKLEDQKREIFTAQFDRYDFARRFKRIYFNHVKNEKGELIKERFWISDTQGKKYDLIGNLLYGEVISFSAQIELREGYKDGFKLIKPIIIRDSVMKKYLPEDTNKDTKL